MSPTRRLDGAPAPTVWEIDESRQEGTFGYDVIHPDDDAKCDYSAIYDASGNGALLNDLVGRIQKGGEQGYNGKGEPARDTIR